MGAQKNFGGTTPHPLAPSLSCPVTGVQCSTCNCQVSLGIGQGAFHDFLLLGKLHSEELSIGCVRRYSSYAGTHFYALRM